MDCKLAELPEGWALTTYEQIGKWSGGGTPSKQIGSYWIGGEIPWISPKDMKSLIIYDSEDRITDDAIKSSSAKLIPSDSLLFVVRSGILRRTLPVALTRIDAAVNQDLKALTPSDHIFADYLLYHALAFNNEIRRSCSKDGTTVESIEFFALKEYPIPLAPLPEQHRIVARIEELFSRLDAGVEALRRAKAQLQRYRQSVLQAAVEGRLTVEWRAAHPEVEPAEKLLERILAERRKRWKERLSSEGNGSPGSKYKEPAKHIPSDLPSLPNRWIWTSYDSVAMFVTSGSRAWKKFLGKGDAIFILLQNLRERQLILDDPTFIDPPDGAEADRTRVLTGDILISIVGNTGVTCLVREIGEAYVSQSVALTRPINLIDGEYLEFYLTSKIGRDFFKGKDYGMGRGHLLLSHIKETPIILPPIAEQHEIIREIRLRFSVIMDLDEAIYSSEIQANRLRQSILQRAFQGKLVPQNPNDEPASLLLERIRAERIKQSPRRVRKSTIHQSRLAQ